MSLVLGHNGRTLFVSADGGATVQATDRDARFLHVLPKLRLTMDELQELGRRRAKLRVSSGTAGVDLAPAGGVQVRRVYNNKAYQVGGSKLTWKGWLVALPSAIKEVTAIMDWEVLLEEGKPAKSVRHELTLRLLPYEEHRGAMVYSMYLSTWPKRDKGSWFGDLAPLNFSPYATLSPAEIQGSRKAWIGEGSTTDHMVLHEVLEVPAQGLDRLFTLRGLAQARRLSIAA